MDVVITDRRFPDRDPYRTAVTKAGGTLEYADLSSEADVIDTCRDAVVVVTFKAPITRAVIEAMESCRLIIRNGTGYDNVDIAAATEHAIPVANIPDYCTEEVASHAIALMLAVSHRVVRSDRTLREADGWGPRSVYRPVHSGTFGVIGFGRIGRATARFARGHQMEVIAYDPYVSADIFEMCDVERVEFDELLRQSDCISLHTPLTGETHHMLAAPEFERMRNNAIVINTARGPLLDQEALYQAVISDQLYGAGLDVFEVEPPRKARVFETDRIVVSPHHAGKTEAAQQRCISIACDKIVRALRDDPLGEIVNPEAYGTADEFSPERTYWEST